MIVYVCFRPEFSKKYCKFSMEFSGFILRAGSKIKIWKKCRFRKMLAGYRPVWSVRGAVSYLQQALASYRSWQSVTGPFPFFAPYAPTCSFPQAGAKTELRCFDKSRRRIWRFVSVPGKAYTCTTNYYLILLLCNVILNVIYIWFSHIHVFSGFLLLFQVAVT